jgi:CheY-like chemotaxis protein
MARIHLLEDDPGQRELRVLLLEMHGHTIVEKAAEAELVLMDLRIPTAADGRDHIRSLHSAHPHLKIIVLTGAAHELRGTPEEPLVHAILEKPCPTGRLLKTLTAAL